MKLFDIYLVLISLALCLAVIVMIKIVLNWL